MAEPIKNKDDQIEKIIGAFWDISKEFEIDKIKNELFSVTNHELRTPLTCINGTLELIKNHEKISKTADLNKLVNIAINNGLRLEKLLNNFLDLQRLETDIYDNKFKPISLENFLADVEKNNFSKSTSKDLHINFVKNKKDIQFKGNINSLHDVMNKLIDNALKFSPPGSEIFVKTIILTKYFTVEIEDSGKGIAEEFMSQIFKPFARENNSIVREHDGLGLSLSICKLIIEQHGGEIGFRKNKPDGTIFYFKLPYQH